MYFTNPSCERRGNLIVFNTPEAHKEYLETGVFDLKEIVSCLKTTNPKIAKDKKMANPALIYAFDNLGPACVH